MGSLDSVSRAMESLSKTFKGDANLESVLSSPDLSTGDKDKMIAELQKFINVQDKDNTVKNFLETLAEHNRLGALKGVCEQFATLMSAARGEVEMTITSASPLDAKIVKQLESAVSKSKYVGQGKKLKVISKVNPDIRGGLVVEIGDRTIDLSVSSKMARMNQVLQEAL
ncbi:F1 complex, OSCP/delta subunit of ATPase [Piedraia hortae CBS 480.64]|uniref:ATP synthase subunit 5, mitochondrial n=1 Tax=Piedraia hortae CBS 480.64 TaxID=1314780 RepID=A0A6A7C4Y4_9PEZI|nr:F1 complex, OSCP/delta subunit of ATPase [Piedraia hortae CBS 480.64]